MTPALSIPRVYRESEFGKLGKALFVLGAGLLAFSSVCLMRRGDPYQEIQSTVLVLFAASAGFILAGESIRGLVHYREQRLGPRFINYLQIPKPEPRVEKGFVDVRCFFCGKSVTGAGHKKGRAESANAASQFGRCLSCGKTVCPRCSYLKGLEMDRKSLRCPGCGGPVY